MSLPNKLLQTAYQTALGLEADGIVEKEIEYVIYGKIVNFDQLSKASSVEHQEQWEIRSKRSDDLQYYGCVRVRHSWDEGDKDPKHTYTLCIKTMTNDGIGKDEVELDCTEDMFEQMKRLATGGMRKTRYCFPFTHSNGTELTWEVDVYQNDDADQLEWCKIDLEVPGRLSGDLPALPIELTEVIDTQPEQRTPEQQAFVDGLMDKYFVMRNEFPKAE